MYYGKAYSIRFKNADLQDVHIKIQDTDTATEFDFGTQYTELTGAGDVLRISTINNDEYKFSPIRAQQATIQFTSDPGASYFQFIVGGDTRWRVEITVGDPVTHTLFLGFLVIDDMTQQFLHPDNNLIVTLVATDNLGLLKNTDLVMPDGTTPRGKYRISLYIYWCLYRTGIDLTLYVVNSIFEENSPGIPFYEAVYLDAKTFESEVGEREDCYTVLEKILGESCILTQYNGGWWIMRLDDITHFTETAYEFYKGPLAVDWGWGGTSTHRLYQFMEVGSDKPMQLTVNTYLRAQRATKVLEETYSYELPREILDNLTFKRGDELPLPAQSRPGSTLYYVEDWTAGNRFANKPPYAATFIQVEQDTAGYETARYAVIGESSLNGTSLFSNPIEVSANDKFSFSLDRRVPLQINTGETVEEVVSQIRLIASDGTFYTLNGVTGKWVSSNSTFQTNNQFINYRWIPNESEIRDWHSVSVDAQPIPKDGVVVILLVQTSLYSIYGDTHFSNISFDYTPYIDGSYTDFYGQRHKITQKTKPDAYKKKIENQVFISDSPKKLFKGAMLNPFGFVTAFSGQGNMGGNDINLGFGDFAAQFLTGETVRLVSDNVPQNTGNYTVVSATYVNPFTRLTVVETIPLPVLVDDFTVYRRVYDGVYSLTTGFYDSRVTPPEGKPYGELQALDVWNQSNRTFRVFDFESFGISTNPSPINLYRIMQQIEDSRIYMLLSVGQDWRTGIMNGTLAEVWDSEVDKVYDDTKEFKYVTER